ncbi:MAG TPA: ATP-binding protein [Cytophagales bacterium]|nr:ATP-binding protein [Cytophagales bacterium]
MKIYENKSRVKAVLLIIAVVIGGASLFYTNIIVKQLADRERKTIELYANALKYSISSDLSDNLSFLIQEIITANNSIPVILTDYNHVPTTFRNLSIGDGFANKENMEYLKEELSTMIDHEPIEVDFGGGEPNYIYYRNSDLLTQLKYYPYVQLTIIGMFVFLAYMAFNYSRSSEQNRVWIGLAKETAHQLGTPLSSLMAWLEYFRSDEKFPPEIIEELDKDIHRLEMITARFSSIGSVPVLKNENVFTVIESSISYLEKRVSNKVKFSINALNKSTTAKLNPPLFEWVIENLIKNAVDAMGGAGSITINIIQGAQKRVFIDVTDTGKGISKTNIKKVFLPGFSTRQRGWGLGLTLVKRIVEIYHDGKIYIKSSEVGKGTTFRIILNR